MTNFKIENLEFEIASPCHEEWNKMSGDDKCRFCDSCEKKVYDLSSMSTKEVLKLVQGPEVICGKIYKREDGTILTEDCPIGIDQIRTYVKRRQYLMALYCGILLMVSVISASISYGDENNRLMGKVAYQVIQGDILEPPVIEKPIVSLGFIAPIKPEKLPAELTVELPDDGGSIDPLKYGNKK